MKQILLSFLLVVLVVAAKAQPATADQIIKEACSKAAIQNKNVFVIFHASWCGWCHRMDKSMGDDVCKQFFDDNFIICHLVVDESKEKVQLENPGAAALRKKYNGEGQGIPFWLIFDKEGKLISDSKMRKETESQESGENMGCPANEKEVDSFIEVLKKSSRMSAEQLAIIRKRFRENEN